MRIHKYLHKTLDFNGKTYTGFHYSLSLPLYYSKEGLAHNFITLGIDPTLSDCLEYVNKSNYVDGVNMMTEYEWHFSTLNIISRWNLSQPLLKDQSEELIDYLLNL